MNPRIVYIFPPNDGPKHWDLATRFVETYNQFPPGCEHDCVIVLNGGKVTFEIRCLFSSLPKVHFLERDDSAWDIGGYQHASLNFASEMMVFFGGSTYFLRGGWLARMKQAFEANGEAIYGATVNRGDLGVKVYPHIRTTGFWLSSKLMNAYPWKITRMDQRYPFEHGPDSITAWVTRQGHRAWLVTWKHQFLGAQWDVPFQQLYRGQQEALLVGDRLTQQHLPLPRPIRPTVRPFARVHA